MWMLLIYEGILTVTQGSRYNYQPKVCGATLQGIADELNNMGIATPPGESVASDGSQESPSKSIEGL
jgi:hypothetical protein